MKDEKLFSNFRPSRYEVSLGEATANSTKASLRLSGKKTGRPSRRITLHQKGLKVKSAKITRQGKRGAEEYEAIRINHLPSFEQVRLHANEMLFPGDYVLVIEYELPTPVPKKAAVKSKPDRTLVPSIDEPAAWEAAEFEVKP